MKKELTNNYILLLLLYLDNQTPIIGRTRLQKIIFLYEKICHKKVCHKKEMNLFDFIEYNYGPFSIKLYEFVKTLKAYNLINYNNNFNKKDFNSDSIDKNTIYSITKDGKEFVENNIIKENLLNSLEIDIINSFKKEYNNIELEKLIRYVYTQYPEYTNKSKIKEKVLGN